MANDTEKSTSSDKGKIVLFRSSGCKAALGVRLDRETVWLNQRQMAELLARARTPSACISALYTNKVI
jgi:hypothetical protein